MIKPSELLVKIKMTEKQIENSILDYLKARKIFAWKNQSVGIFDPVANVYRKSHNRHHLNGVADILGVYRGRFLAIEVKADKGKATEEQIRFLDTINKSGGIAFVARSIDDVVEALGRL